MSALLALSDQAAGAGLSPAETAIFLTCMALLVGITMLLIRAIKGPTVYDRILAVNAIGTKTVLLVACIAFLDLDRGTPGFFIDTSIVYALINFVATIAILKYIEYRRLN